MKSLSCKGQYYLMTKFLLLLYQDNLYMKNIFTLYVKGLSKNIFKNNIFILFNYNLKIKRCRYIYKLFC